GRSTWTAEEKLPADFFHKLRSAVDVDAVLVGRLTQYRAYEPLAIGWRLKLIDADGARIVWATDEVFDAQRTDVANAARRYAKAHPASVTPVGDSRRILVSPRRFAQYTANEVVKTLPPRAGQILPNPH